MHLRGILYYIILYYIILYYRPRGDLVSSQAENSCSSDSPVRSREPPANYFRINISLQKSRDVKRFHQFSFPVCTGKASTILRAAIT